MTSVAGPIDALTDRSPDGVLWSRVNSGEALPGVMTPMTWSFYGKTLETNARLGFADLGIMPRSAAVYPEGAGDRLLGVFHGRLSVNVNVARRMMSGLPGVSGDDVERDMLGSVREGVTEDDVSGRLAAVLAKAPGRLAISTRQAARTCAENHGWWVRHVGPQGPRTGVDPIWLLRDALARYGVAVRLQGQIRMMFQGATAHLTELAARAGQPEAASSLLAGTAGTEEAAVADDLWLLANDRMALADFLARHGFHGPNSGETASRSWREDPAPLERLLAAVRDSEPTAERRARAAAERATVTARVLAALPRRARARARVALRVTPWTVRALERTKTSFLMTGDAARCAVRAAGAELTAADRLADRDDGFHLFAEELLDPAATDLRPLVAERRAIRERCLEVEIPETWVGQPRAYPKLAPSAREVTSVTGLGASPGVVEGRVRVVLDAAGDVDVEPGDVLVCPTTDPSWIALMAVASALVIDIGAAASHGAIVARELGVPCVIGTRTGTTDLRDGDHVRVDGSTGSVELLHR